MGKDRLATLQSLTLANGPLDQCKGELLKLEETLKHQKNGIKGVVNALKWPLDEAYTTKTLERIERTKTTLNLALSTDQINLNLLIKDDTSALINGVKSLTLKDTSDAERKSSHVSFLPPRIQGVPARMRQLSYLVFGQSSPVKAFSWSMWLCQPQSSRLVPRRRRTA